MLAQQDAQNRPQSARAGTYAVNPLRPFSWALCVNLGESGDFPHTVYRPLEARRGRRLSSVGKRGYGENGFLMGSRSLTQVSVRIASDSLDFDAARELCLEWLDWHWKEYPGDWPVEDNPMAHDKFNAIVTDLERLHARPTGAIMIGFVDEKPVGCVMYNEAQPGVAEFKRMFVGERGRGHGLGRLMLEHMFAQMVADGYEKVFFSSAKFLIHARAMYVSAGFVDMPHPSDFPDQWRDYVYFMQRPLM